MTSDSGNQPVPALDPSRRFTGGTRRRDIAKIIERAQALPPEDYAAVRSVFEGSVPLKSLAALSGRDEQSFRRRFHRVVRRVMSPEFVLVRDRRHEWSPLRARIATAVFIHGLSLRGAAREQRLPLHVVREHAMAVRALAGALVGGLVGAAE
jgi:hypothetical protein